MVTKTDIIHAMVRLAEWDTEKEINDEVIDYIKVACCDKLSTLDDSEIISEEEEEYSADDLIALQKEAYDEMAASCTCGAYKLGKEGYAHVADCICGNAD